MPACLHAGNAFIPAAMPLSLQAYVSSSIVDRSVADPGCLSRILIFTHPGSRIPDLGSRIQKQQQKRVVKKKFDVIPFYVATNFTKLYIILILKC
jgi:hypothetical protein